MENVTLLSLICLWKRRLNVTFTLTCAVPVLNLPVFLVCVKTPELLQKYSLSLVSSPPTVLYCHFLLFVCRACYRQSKVQREVIKLCVNAFLFISFITGHPCVISICWATDTIIRPKYTTFQNKSDVIQLLTQLPISAAVYLKTGEEDRFNSIWNIFCINIEPIACV